MPNTFSITLIAGARPNFMKIAPIIHELKQAQDSGASVKFRLVHTGQHYDANMSGSFFNQLGIPEPDVNLECSGGSQAQQTASIMIAFEKELIQNPADLVLVVGDVTSTMACTIVAKKLNTKVAHVEAGIRSGDMSMPEEINRIVTDSLTDFFFTTTDLANENLIKSGVMKENVFLVGNTMIDTLLKQQPHFIKPELWQSLNLKEQHYFVLTMHRPANVDEEYKLQKMLQAILTETRDVPIIFPAHPRTQQILNKLDIKSAKLHVVEPLSYLEFNYLVKYSKAVITDSGGITEEASIMNVPCITLRNNTERPETITLGTNILAGTNPENLKPYFDILFNNQWKQAKPILYWDGNTAKRIVQTILNTIKN